MKKIVFAIVMILSAVNLSANEPEFTTSDVHKSFELNYISVNDELYKANGYYVSITSKANVTESILQNTKTKKIYLNYYIHDCRITFYQENADGTYSNARSAFYEDVAIATLKTDNYTAFGIFLDDNDMVVGVVVYEDKTMLKINYLGDFSECTIKN